MLMMTTKSMAHRALRATCIAGHAIDFVGIIGIKNQPKVKRHLWQNRIIVAVIIEINYMMTTINVIISFLCDD